MSCQYGGGEWGMLNDASFLHFFLWQGTKCERVSRHRMFSQSCDFSGRLKSSFFNIIIKYNALLNLLVCTTQVRTCTYLVGSSSSHFGISKCIPSVQFNSFFISFSSVFWFFEHESLSKYVEETGNRDFTNIWFLTFKIGEENDHG